MPGFDDQSLSGESDGSVNILQLALDEMERIIAESKISLEALSVPTKPEVPRKPDKLRAAFRSANESTRANIPVYQNSVPGNCSPPNPVGPTTPVAPGKNTPTNTAESSSRIIMDFIGLMRTKPETMKADGLKQEDHELLLGLICGEEIRNKDSRIQALSTQADRLETALKLAEDDRNNLRDQLSFLADQVNRQSDKIRELEDLLQERNSQLESTEALLEEEMLTRSALETHKLDLLAEITDLRAQMLATKKENLRLLQSESQQDAIPKSVSSENLREANQNQMPAAAQLLLEIEQDRLRKTVELLTAALEEKDKRILELQRRLTSRDQEAVPRYLEERFEEKSHNASRKPPYVSKSFITDSPRLGHPLTYQTQNSSATTGSQNSLTRPTDSVSFSSDHHDGVSGRFGSRRDYANLSSRSSYRSRSSDARYLQAINQESAFRRSGSFRVSPRLSERPIYGSGLPLSASSKPAYGHLRTGSLDFNICFKDSNRCNSVPNLGKIGGESSERIRCSTPKSGTSEEKRNGIKKFFEKLTKGHSSGSEEDIYSGSFKRGGIRATAGPRLQNLQGSLRRKWNPTEPLNKWTHDMVLQWIEGELQIPLSMTARTWLVNGDQLCRVTEAEIEKELNLNSPLTRKKFFLALQAAKENDKHPMSKWDYMWVLKWLDDVGLPQYKEPFSQARVDGRTLNYLTVDDLLHLKITNAIHHASIAQGIMVLRACNYEPSSIRRRPLEPQDPLEAPASVLFWSNHRVMEWLRFLDLTEYSPNLRGSGVHGGLMVLENRFNADVLADILSIPQSKTLLRRHLSKSFVELIGSEMMRHKRAAEASPGYVPLSPHLKLKNRKGFHLGRKKTKTEDQEELLCPLDAHVDLFLLERSGGSSNNSASPSSVSSSLDRKPNQTAPMDTSPNLDSKTL